MRILFLPDVLTILLCILVWPLFQVGVALICVYLPDRYFSPDSFLFRSHRFEREGRIYDRIFRVNRWKHLLPDGGVFWKKRGYQKKRLFSFSEQNLKKFLVESSRGELSHWLAILPFWVFGLIAPPQVIWYMLMYALLVNLPCIITQRYNRPRISNLLHKLSAKQWGAMTGQR